MHIPHILSIAGSDSSGGAGIQADLKTIAYHGCFGMSVITAVTAQNSHGVIAIGPINPKLIDQQIQSVIHDARIDAIKIGLLPSIDAIDIVANKLKKIDHIPVIIDPVMISTSGFRFLSEKILSYLAEKLFPLSQIITPNLSEAEALIGKPIISNDDIEKAGYELMNFGPNSILITGGDRSDESADDCLITSEGTIWFRQSKIRSKNIRGTGCTLSSAISCFLAKGYPLSISVRAAKAFITECLSTFQEASAGAVFPTIPKFSKRAFL